MDATLEQSRFPHATVTIIIVTVVAFFWQVPLIELLSERIQALTYTVPRYFPFIP